VLLRSALKTKPQLRSCLSRCRHCGIYFITDPRNAGRTDLGCPFGCQEAHRKCRSTARSVEYYREESGRIKKKIQNEKRRKGVSGTPSEPDVEVKDVEYDLRMLSYVQMLTSLIEGWRVSLEEVKAMLARALRQRSIARRREIDHVVAALREHPP